MMAPEFWWSPPERPGMSARALAPLGWIAARATAARVAKTPRLSPDVPVISVGNLTLGGGGKTPLVIFLCEYFIRMGLRIAVLSRGYGGRLDGPVQVDPRKHHAHDVGDEPLLIAAFAPVYVARQRDEAARLALADGASLLILDDGHQNPDIRKDLRLVAVDAPRGFGNHRVAPAGPLREPVPTGLSRADLLIPIGTAPEREHFRSRTLLPPDLKISEAELCPLQTGMPWAGLRVLAFAGIARPEKFFATLRALGAEVVERVPLSDHQPLDARLLARMAAQAERAGLRLVTTEKDAVRLPSEWRREVLTLAVRLTPRDDLLTEVLETLM